MPRSFLIKKHQITEAGENMDNSIIEVIDICGHDDDQISGIYSHLLSPNLTAKLLFTNYSQIMFFNSVVKYVVPKPFFVSHAAP